MTPQPPLRSANKTLLKVAAGVGIALGVTCLLGTLGAIAVPRFRNARLSSRRAEAKMTLKVLLTQEEAFRAKEGVWATAPRELVEYANSGPQNFTCFLSSSGAWGGRGERIAFGALPPEVQQRLARNEAAAPELVLACAANLDADPQLDVWTISSTDPTPKQELDDSAP